MKTLGIIAGLGPLAGAHFYRRVIELSPAISDAEHIPVILISEPSIPSRIEHLSGSGESPVPKLVDVAEKLVHAGANLIAMPSTTTSIYHEQIASQIPIPMISLIEEVADTVEKSGKRKIGIMGTTPTRTFRVYENAFHKTGIEAVYPDEKTQSEIMEVITAVKSASASGFSSQVGRADDSIKELGKQAVQLAQKPWSQDLDGILLACTELPVIFPPDASVVPKLRGALFRSTDILATAVIRELYACDYLVPSL
ncbi:amino acid racemase [Alicyclobacillus fastidiosus]|uniref:Amino acid racemase n=1 Tax=Alicyclobacillus fastidiosus TaxID=392011 RepID=A0ABY6ZHW9_9BACL|nr:amino acid racemase [Alicyclobacillus fastidiosus]WAH42447.1 amino acid racemase [Alicyclobacillus fastidiosus]GMA64276.1 aspartate racemase [Alicyclobacillus fastidiosus]